MWITSTCTWLLAGPGTIDDVTAPRPEVRAYTYDTTTDTWGTAKDMGARQRFRGCSAHDEANGKL